MGGTSTPTTPKFVKQCIRYIQCTKLINFSAMYPYKARSNLACGPPKLGPQNLDEEL